MRVLQINTRYYNGGSTGRITYDLKKVMEAQGIESYVAYGFKYEPKAEEKASIYKTENELQLFISKVWTKLIGHHAFDNTWETKRLIKWIDQVKPDIIHMHNLHNNYVNIHILLTYIAEHNIPCVLTMHDCWTFTGHCAYFDYIGCGKWLTGCHHCSILKEYPKTFAPIDPSPWNYRHKKELFAPLNITFVTPSRWLHDLQQRSFLKNKPCIVINNGVDTSVFHPIQSNVRQIYGIGQRKMILAVAAGLTQRKGRDYLLKLPLLLNEDEVLVLVGLQKNQRKLLPNTKKIIGLQRTHMADELVGLYSEADVFINPTLEDNFPTTNLEALACGTPVVTFDTGGSGECVDSSTGLVVPKGHLEEMLKGIRSVISKGKGAYQEACMRKARAMYNKDRQYMKYIELYHKLLDKRNNYAS